MIVTFSSFHVNFSSLKIVKSSNKFMPFFKKRNETLIKLLSF
jgi:hypothetical protein